VRRAIFVGVMLAASAAHAECPPTALSSGDPVLARSLSDRLAANGIATTSIDGCPAVRVRVEQRGDQLHLEMADAFARVGQRQVRDVATAAAVVESWTRHEIEEGSMPALVDAAPLVARPASSATGLGLAFESSIGDDSSLWIGAAASGCVAMGPVCTGGLIRGARDTRSTGDTQDSNHRSSELHALATVDLPRRLGAFTISPGAGIGYGWLDITSTHLDIHMLPVEDSVSSHALRGEVHVTFTRRIGGGFALVGDVRADSALARTEIPGGPRGFVRAAFGLRFGAP
jgi:hypothetical protein